MKNCAKSAPPVSCTNPNSLRRHGECFGTRSASALATEFACHWLQIDDFDISMKRASGTSPRSLVCAAPWTRNPIQFFTDLFQHNRLVLNILDSDYTFLNEPSRSTTASRE